jgi:2'-5' RNA ligase
MIDFKKKFEPHITLFLTVFESNEQLTAIEEGVYRAAQNMSRDCQVNILNSIAATGTYTMWDVQNSECLQHMSDLVVNATSAYVSKKAKTDIPKWVESLPPAIRDIKIAMIHQYGSPNVFSQFQPHVTLAYDDQTPDVMKQVVHKYVNATGCTFTAFEIGVGSTGPYGTVQRGLDLFDQKLQSLTDMFSWFSEEE